jgi:hypothetical protein
VRFSPQSDRVLYVADQDVDNVHELYASPLPHLRNAPAPRGKGLGR